MSVELSVDELQTSGVLVILTYILGILYSSVNAIFSSLNTTYTILLIIYIVLRGVEVVRGGEVGEDELSREALRTSRNILVLDGI